jgi:superfamily II DNA or RNA helicase
MEEACHQCQGDLFFNLCLVNDISVDKGDIFVPQNDAFNMLCVEKETTIDGISADIIRKILKSHIIMKDDDRIERSRDGLPIKVEGITIKTYYFVPDGCGRWIFFVDRLLECNEGEDDNEEKKDVIENLAAATASARKKRPRKLRYSVEEFPIPHLPKLKMKDYQENCVIHMFHHRSLIVCYPTGSGKTLIGTTTSVNLLREGKVSSVVFVGPKSVKLNFWQTIIDNFDLTDDESVNINLYTFHKFTDLYLAGEINTEGALIVIDEAHSYRTVIGVGDKYRRPPHIIKKKSGAVRVKAMLTAASEASSVMMLTATPGVNFCRDFCNYIAILRGEKVPMDDSEFHAEICSKNGRVRDREAFNEFFKDCISIYHLPPEILAEYPRVRDHKIDIQMTEEFHESYMRVESETVTEKQQETLKSSNLIAFWNGTRRVVGCKIEEDNPKLTWIFEFCKNNRFKTLIFSNFIDLGIKELQRTLRKLRPKPMIGIIQGSCTEKERKETVDDYNNDEIDILLISTKSGGVGLDFKGTRAIIITQNGWNLSDALQARGRGVRFRSHMHLPEDQRIVDVYLLSLVRPGESQSIPAVDMKLFEMGVTKNENISALMLELETLSI